MKKKLYVAYGWLVLVVAFGFMNPMALAEHSGDKKDAGGSHPALPAYVLEPQYDKLGAKLKTVTGDSGLVLKDQVAVKAKDDGTFEKEEAPAPITLTKENAEKFGKWNDFFKKYRTGLNSCRHSGKGDFAAEKLGKLLDGFVNVLQEGVAPDPAGGLPAVPGHMKEKVLLTYVNQITDVLKQKVDLHGKGKDFEKTDEELVDLMKKSVQVTFKTEFRPNAFDAEKAKTDADTKDIVKEADAVRSFQRKRSIDDVDAKGCNATGTASPSGTPTPATTPTPGAGTTPTPAPKTTPTAVPKTEPTRSLRPGAPPGGNDGAPTPNTTPTPGGPVPPPPPPPPPGPEVPPRVDVPPTLPVNPNPGDVNPGLFNQGGQGQFDPNALLQNALAGLDNKLNDALGQVARAVDALGRQQNQAQQEQQKDNAGDLAKLLAGLQGKDKGEGNQQPPPPLPQVNASPESNRSAQQPVPTPPPAEPPPPNAPPPINPFAGLMQPQQAPAPSETQAPYQEPRLPPPLPFAPPQGNGPNIVDLARLRNDIRQAALAANPNGQRRRPPTSVAGLGYRPRPIPPRGLPQRMMGGPTAVSLPGARTTPPFAVRAGARSLKK